MMDLSKYTDDELKDMLLGNIEVELKKRGYAYGWYKRNIYAGVIYILMNPAFPTLVKIGYADDIDKRLKTLNCNSGLPDPYHCYAIYKVKKRLEDLKLHFLIDSLDSTLRHTKNREFYEMTVEKAFAILQAIAEINGEEELLIYNPFKDKFFDNVVKKDGDNTSALEKPLEILFTVKDLANNKYTRKPFTTWKQFEVDICEMIIDTYGSKTFSSFVLDEDIKSLHTSKKHMFGVTDDLMLMSTRLSNGVYLNTNNSSIVIKGVVDLLVQKFTKVQYRFIDKNKAIKW